MKSLSIVLPLALLATGCASVPKPKNLVDNKPDTTDIGRALMVRVACEISSAKKLSELTRRVVPPKPEPVPGQPEKPAPEPHAAYDISVALTFKAETTGGLAPTVNFINTFGGNDDTRTAILGFTLERGRSREVTETFSINALNLPGDFKPGSELCKRSESDVRGEFGLADVIDDHFGHNLPTGIISGPGHKDDEFKSTIIFTLTKGGSAGPHWETKHFKGPSSDGLLNGKRTDTNQLFISFASHDAEKPPGVPTKAREGITESILRSLLLTPR